MFRWLALCLVLCAGAFALVAMATGAFNHRVESAVVEPLRPPARKMRPPTWLNPRRGRNWAAEAPSSSRTPV